MSDTIIETERLILRQWRDSDLQIMAQINHDPRVMEHFPAPRTLEETKAFINGSKALFKEVGYCFYAAELKDTQELIGFVGIAPVYEMPCTPAVEIGWRLGTKFWGQGFATEAARAVINYAFGTLGIDELVTFTATTNKKSERVMQRLGFSRSEQDDFDHPRIMDGHPLNRHIFYRLKSDSGKLHERQSNN
ncbi:MAG: GNAT family N-acetyltransferase [Gammaproteobacteria bacterium]|nr:GNAT family N-acetyltransferase [Gammaproteobacteria bacterium]